MWRWNLSKLISMGCLSLVVAGCGQGEMSDKGSGTKSDAPPPQAAQEDPVKPGEQEAAKPAANQQFVLTDVNAQVVEPEGVAGTAEKPKQPAPQPQYQLAEQKVEVIGGPDAQKKGGQPAPQLQLTEQRVNVIGGPEGAQAKKPAPQLQLTDQKVEFVGGPKDEKPAGAGAQQLTITDQQVQVVEPIEAVPSGRPNQPAPAPAKPIQKSDAAKPAPGADRTVKAAMSGPPADGPHWACDETTHNFGEVWAGENVKWTFEYRNTGTKTLKILEAKPTCGCTALKDYTKSLEPGEIGKMTLVLNTSKLTSSVTKTIKVETNDPIQSSMPLAMTGFVKSLFAMNPQQGASFGSARADKPLTRKITLKNTTDDPVSLELQSIAGSKAYTAEVKETVPGKEFEVTVNATPPLVKGSNTANITFKTGHPKVPTYTMTANAYVQPRVQVNPPKLVVSTPADRESEWTVRIFNNGDEPLELLEFRTSEPRFRPRLVNMQPDAKHAYELRITIPKDYMPPAHSESVEIKTNDPEFGTLQIPIQPTFRDPTPRPAGEPAKWTVVDKATGLP